MASTAQDVARFVEEYYDTLQKKPESAAQGFYMERVSNVVRPDGTAAATTVASINDALLPLKYGKFVIEKFNSAHSLNGLVHVLVTAWVETETARKKFVQTFSLAPESQRGYFVVTDMVEYLQEEAIVKPKAPAPAPVMKKPVEQAAVKKPVVVEAVVKPAAVAKEPAVVLSSPPPSSPVVKVAEPVKWIASVRKEKPKAAGQEKQKHKDRSVFVRDLPAGSREGDVFGMFRQFGSVKKVREIPADLKSGRKCFWIVEFEQGESAYKAVTASPLTRSSDKHTVTVEFMDSTGPQRTPTQKPTEKPNQKPAVSVYVKNLPKGSSVDEVYQHFEIYGKIKNGKRGVSVRHNPESGFCYGFVDFEERESAQKAVNASPLRRDDGRFVYIEHRATRPAPSSSSQKLD